MAVIFDGASLFSTQWDNTGAWCKFSLLSCVLEFVPNSGCVEVVDGMPSAADGDLACSVGERAGVRHSGICDFGPKLLDVQGIHQASWHFRWFRPYPDIFGSPSHCFHGPSRYAFLPRFSKT